MLRVGLAPCEPEAVFNLRARWPGHYLADRGEIEIVKLPEQLHVKEHHGKKGHWLSDLKDFPDVDVVVLTRVLAERIVNLIPLLQERGIAVVLNIDDDFRHLPPLMAGHRRIDPLRNPRYNWRHYARACALADLVICAAPALQVYASSKSVVIRNAVPDEYTGYRVKHHSITTVGWSGSVTAHAGDLDVTHGGVAQALEAVNARFSVVGEGEGVGQRIGLPVDPPSTGGLSHEQYPLHVAQLDLGVVPLADNTYNQSKSWITPLTMAAVGVPCVVSPFPEYEELASRLHGCPTVTFAGPRGRQWKAAVLRALRMPEDEREEAVRYTRMHVSRELSLEANAWRWLEAWHEALKLREGKAHVSV